MDKVLEKFKKNTGFDINLLFIEIGIFFQSDYLELIKYYSGQKTDISNKHYENLDYINSKVEILLNLIDQFDFKNVDISYLLEKIEAVDTSIKSVYVLNKWLRSSITAFGYRESNQINYQLSQNQNLESVSRKVNNSDSFQDDWVDIAINNNLLETDYDSNGGLILNLPVNSYDFTLSLEDVVDTINGKSCYGKDINKILTFENQDLASLGFSETALQSVNILANLCKNDNPEFPEIGIQKDFFLGSNYNIFSVPVLTRQLNENFKTDKTFTSFVINEFKKESDNFHLSFVVETVFGEIIPNSSTI